MSLGGRLRTLRLRAPLATALDVELRGFDRMAMRLWQAMTAGGALAGLGVTLAFPGPMGLTLAGACLGYLLWFSFVRFRLRDGPAGPAMEAAIVAVESSVPWVFLALLVLTEGAAYAIASWVPPMLFIAIVVGHGARLRIRAPILVGVLGALTYPLLYFLWLAPALEPEVEGLLLYQPGMQITRTLSLLAAGAIGALMGHGLRRAIARADKAIRETELIGKYQLTRRIARGGMGAIFEAVYCPEGGFERRVAIKRIHPHLAEQPRFVELFRREAEISSRLAHPNIVQVMDFGRVQDSYFLAMEYVEGLPLNAFMRRAFRAKAVLPPHVVATMGRDILSGLAHAHAVAMGPDGQALRVVHRDLCPQNLLVSRHGVVKITDFGVARALRDAESSHTRTVVGHHGYIAPEQARGNPVDPRADLFPLGVILWELLAGRRLFRRDHEAATMQALLFAAIPKISVRRPEIDPRWDALIGKALARQSEDRWQSAQAMLAFLDEIPDGRAEGASRELAEFVARLMALDRTPEPEGDQAETLVDAQGPVAEPSAGPPD